MTTFVLPPAPVFATLLKSGDKPPDPSSVVSTDVNVIREGAPPVFESLESKGRAESEVSDEPYRGASREKPAWPFVARFLERPSIRLAVYIGEGTVAFGVN